MKLKKLSEQTVVITGATSGIGLAAARRAARKGAHVVLVARDEEALTDIARSIREDGGKADHVAADVGVREQVRNVVDTVVRDHGGFDTWVNDAGVGVYATLEEVADDDHRRMFETNYWGVVHGTTEALKHLKGKGGAIINIGSVSSDMPAPMLSAYTATKHAVKGFHDSLRMELIADRIPVSLTLIKPAGISTPFGDHAKNYMDGASQVPPPVYDPELVANAICAAAQVSYRAIVVGGVGRMQTLMANVAPRLWERMMPSLFERLAVDKDRPPQDTTGLHEPGYGGEVYGTQAGHVRKTSLYTTMRLHPIATMSALAVLGIAGVAGIASVMSEAARSAARRSAWRG